MVESTVEQDDKKKNVTNQLKNIFWGKVTCTAYLIICYLKFSIQLNMNF